MISKALCEWVREQFSKQGISYRQSQKTKSELYLEALPQFRQGAVSLLDNQLLRVELMQLERRTARSGKDSVDHPPGARDDHANAACGCLTLLAATTRGRAHMVKFTGF